MGQMHSRLGFQQSWFRSAYQEGDSIGLGLADEAFFAQTASRLARMCQPFFAYLISSSAHYPFLLPDAQRTFDPGRFGGTLVGNYLQSIHYFDRAFGHFLDALRENGVLDRSAMVVFGDHQAHISEELELAGLLVSNGRLPQETQALSELQRWQVSKDVPFLIRLPGGDLAGEYPAVGGHIDIAPTLLSLAGLQDDRGGVMLGRDLLAAESRPTLFRDGSVATGDRIFVRNTDTTFDLSSGASTAGDRHQFAATASREFRASDAIIRGNLVSRLLTGPARAAGPRRPSRTQVIAHRGNSVRAPENTLPAIQMAFDAGADAVEIDVRLSRDGVPVVLHEDNLDHTTDGSGPAAALTLAELKELDAGGWMAPQFRHERIPTLEEVLAVARGRGRLLIDVKADGMAALVADTYRRLGVPPGEAMIGAWEREQVDEFVQHMPGALILRSHGTISNWNVDYFKWLMASGVGGLELADPWAPALVDAVREVGLLMIAYTVNDEGTIRRLIRMGVDGIETDDPELAVGVCREADAS